MSYRYIPKMPSWYTDNFPLGYHGCSDADAQLPTASPSAPPPPLPPNPPPPPPPAPPGSSPTVCLNTCGGGRTNWLSDGECDDGGTDSEYSECTVCTDCTDCGPRPAAQCDGDPSVPSGPQGETPSDDSLSKFVAWRAGHGPPNPYCMTIFPPSWRVADWFLESWLSRHRDHTSHRISATFTYDGGRFP